MDKQGIIISGFGGVGKTTLAQKYKNVIDIESNMYKYDYSGIKKSDYEKMKGNPERKRNPEYPQNYVNAIKEAAKKYDIVCVRYNGDMEVDFYDTYKLDYVVCHPTKKAYKKYVERFRNRGNSEEWIKKNQGYFEICLKRSKGLKNKILLHDDETLEDALKKRNFNLIPR